MIVFFYLSLKILIFETDLLQDESEFTLKNISFEVTPGKLTGVIGTVGSGKSSLLMALLGEMPNIKGDIKVNGKIFYVSQEPWIFSATIRQNILFGKEYDQEKIDTIIDICALRDV